MVPQVILSWSAAIIAVGGALGILWKLFYPLASKTKKLMDALSLFTEDWFGSEGDAVHPRKPGMLERIRSVEGELKHNGGSSIKDAVRRIENKLTEIDARLEEGALRFDEIEKDLEGKADK